jgi:hypothetical protein
MEACLQWRGASTLIKLLVSRLMEEEAGSRGGGAHADVSHVDASLVIVVPSASTRVDQPSYRKVCLRLVDSDSTAVIAIVHPTPLPVAIRLTGPASDLTLGRRIRAQIA